MKGMVKIWIRLRKRLLLPQKYAKIREKERMNYNMRTREEIQTKIDEETEKYFEIHRTVKLKGTQSELIKQEGKIQMLKWFLHQEDEPLRNI